ncbi:YecA family protein [Nitrospina gracilis]|uniref:YecA family protein n=1 Tax=Nitrospina gracilis TaxID=35801 RepID=UPI001F372555|nr:hypothetical protein [Nitrospina gracilis Nb-211]
MGLNDKENDANRFSFIVHFNKTTALLPNHPSLTEKQKKILEEFKGELTDEMILHFKQRYMEAKAYGEKNPMSYLVFEPGQYVNYMELFPRSSKLLDFSYKDQKHFAEDSYELDPRNDNKSVRMTFFKFEEGQQDKVPPLFTYTYYFNETLREEEDAKLEPKNAALLLGFHQFIPNLHEILKDRYKEAKKIGEELMKTTPDIKFQSHKPQRNDLCPCGSGKKFKKCCALKVN